jgi:hypothetical protein
MTSNVELMLAPDITSLIHSLRGERVILDADLARLYGVPTKAFNQAVKRKISRFPADFQLRLNLAESEGMTRSQIVTGHPLKSQSVTSNAGRGGRRHLPYALTEQTRNCLPRRRRRTTLPHERAKTARCPEIVFRAQYRLS